MWLDRVHYDAIKKGLEEGRQQGMQEGMQQGVRDTILDLLQIRFNLADRDMETRLAEIDDLTTLRRLAAVAGTAVSADIFLAALDEQGT
jgi:predicted transposase YdaD